jgi:predicted nucleotide-binding protein
MPTSISVYASPSSPKLTDIEQSVQDANGLQTEFRFQLSRLGSLDGLPRGKLDPKRFDRTHHASAPRGIILCDRPFQGGRVVHELPPERVYVTCDLPGSLAATPFRLYLLYQLASAAAAIGTGLNRTINSKMIHKPPVGCLWDSWTNATEQNAVMVVARICTRCQGLLQTHSNERGAEKIAACLEILEYVRRSMLGKSPEIANRIFVAYGRSDDWKELVSILKTLGFDVEHFNSQAAAGYWIAERWQEMLNRSRFAFAVMTPDDELSDKKRQARQNVVHEIGLCHAKLGVRNTAILIADGTEPFSNVQGLVHIPFKTGKLDENKPDIIKLLTDRGLLSEDGARPR